MNNEWLNDLRRKMEDHTEDVPDGLWKNIREELFVENEEKKGVGIGLAANDLKAKEKVTSTKGYRSLFYRIAGVAAVLGIFFIVGKMFDFNFENKTSNLIKPIDNHKYESSKTSSNHQKLSGKKTDTALQNFSERRNNLNTIEINNSNQIFVAKAFGKMVNKVRNQIDNPFLNTLDQNQNQSEKSNNQNTIQKEEITIAELKESEENQPDNELLSKEEKGWKDKLEEEKLKITNKKSKKVWMVSLLTGNASANSTEQFPGYATLNGTTYSLPEIRNLEMGEDPLMSILLANQDKKVDAKLKHKTPVTFGASLYYNLGKRWGIGTGINYTKLSSELTSGTSSNFVGSEQTIHYVGIPVQVNYNVIQKGAFTGYITGGGTVEKAVSGNIKTQYIVDGTVKEETKENISEKPVQVSVNGAVGLQLKIIKNIGIYAEPGVGYHFNDNSSLNTIYKEKPLNFNLKFGIRVSLD